MVLKIQNNLLLLLFILIVLFLTRQVPFNSYSFIMNISLILFFIFNYRYILININKDKILKQLFFLTIGISLLMIFYSLYLENEPSLIIRFYLIIVLIFLAYFVKPDKKYINIFIFFIGIQALFLICFEIYLMANFSIDTYYPIRHFFLNNNWGDVYTYNGIIWKIQLKGNALLPFAFFISMVYYKGFKRSLIAGLFFVATLLAGNFAYILGIILFLGLYYIYSKRWTIQKIVLNGFIGIILTIVLFNPTYNYFSNVVEQKSGDSNSTRIDQTNVLVENMNKNLVTILFGQGLGNTVDVKTEWRDYSGAIYYELQAFYIMNQSGILFFTFFILINILLAYYMFKYKLLFIVYASYIFYALFNPYFLDTSHIVAIIILLSLRKVFDEKNIFNTRSI